jgi:lysophospholipase L1-like esterase
VMTPPPLYISKDQRLNLEAPTIVREIAQELGLGEVVDVFEALGGTELNCPSLFGDKVHPTDEGYAKIAQTVAERILKELSK